VLAQLRRGVVSADDDLGKALVVAQQHVEARLHLLDQIDLEQQRVGLGPRGDELHRPRQIDHVGDALGVETALGVLDHPLLQAAGLAHIEHLAVLADHAIDARRLGQPLHLVLDQGRALQRLGVRFQHGAYIGHSRAARSQWRNRMRVRALGVSWTGIAAEFVAIPGGVCASAQGGEAWFTGSIFGRCSASSRART